MNSISRINVIVSTNGPIMKLKQCLESIIATRTIPFNLIILYSCKEKRKQKYIKSVVKRYGCKLIENEDIKSYTHSSMGEYSVFIYENVKMEKCWLEHRLVKDNLQYCGFDQETWSRPLGIDPAILFLLPLQGGSGGVHSVFQEVKGLQAMNVNAKIATKLKYKDQLLEHYSDGIDNCIFYESVNELKSMTFYFDIVVATAYNTVKTLNQLLQSYSHIKPAYYIQDYEPYFFPKNTKRYDEALQSYELIPSIHAFAKTEWLCNLVRAKHGLTVFKVKPSLDRTIFYPNLAERKENEAIYISAMIRPSTPRRSPERTIQVLRRMKEIYGSKVEIMIFGCTNSELESLKMNIDTNIKNCGVLTREGVVKVLQRSNIFIDLSSYQAFGRTGLEAMAVGCSTVLPIEGGTSEYAIHEENCYLVDSNENDKVIDYICRLVEDSKLRERFLINGLKTAAKFSIEDAVQSEYHFFQHIMKQT